MVERSADQRIRTTEWEDIQYKHGNRVGKYRDREMEILAQKIGDANPNVCLKAYDPVEERARDKADRGGFDVEGDQHEYLDNDEAGDDDDDAVAMFRQKRLAEMQKHAETHVFGVVRHIPGSDYVKEITEASNGCCVVAAMIGIGHDGCDALITALKKAAPRNRDVKFVSLFAKEAIPNFPDKHLPCVLIYENKTMIQQVTGMETWSTKNDVSIESVERALQKFGVICKEEYLEDDEEIDLTKGSRYNELLKRR